jgi:hypothetical protein
VEVEEWLLSVDRTARAASADAAATAANVSQQALIDATAALTQAEHDIKLHCIRSACTAAFEAADHAAAILSETEAAVIEAYLRQEARQELCRAAAAAAKAAAEAAACALHLFMKATESLTPLLDACFKAEIEKKHRQYMSKYLRQATPKRIKRVPAANVEVTKSRISLSMPHQLPARRHFLVGLGAGVDKRPHTTDGLRSLSRSKGGDRPQPKCTQRKPQKVFNDTATGSAMHDSTSLPIVRHMQTYRHDTRVAGGRPLQRALSQLEEFPPLVLTGIPAATPPQSQLPLPYLGRQVIKRTYRRL